MRKIFLVLTIIGLVFVGCGKVEQKAQYNYISGGMLELTNPKLALKQINSRANQTKCDVIVSYCQSCSESMSKGGKKGVHILDLIYDERMKVKMKQESRGTIKKWFYRYKSKIIIEVANKQIIVT